MTIGVAAVIVLVAVGNGSKQAVQARHRRARLQHAASCSRRAARCGPGGSPAAAAADAHAPATPTALQDAFNAPDVKTRRRRWSTRRARRWSPARRATSRARSSAPTPAYATTRDYQVAGGAMFTDADVKQHRRVVVLGPTVVAEPVRRPGPGRPDGARRRHELPGRRRDRVQGLQRRPGPGRRRDRAASPRCRTRSPATARLSIDHRPGAGRAARSTPRRPR